MSMDSSSQPPITTVSDNDEFDQFEDDMLDDSEPDPDGFNMREVLPRAQTTVRTTKELHELIHEGVIDLNPPYQRDVVWTAPKQSQLIDSIYRNYAIPPVIFSVRQDEEVGEVWVCVDGKQRLSSIQKFFDGQIPHKDTANRKIWWYTFSDTQKGLHHEVPQRWKEVFATKQITCTEYRNLTPGQEMDIFQRVQLGVSLTAAEKLQAYDSPWSNWISDLEQRHIRVDGGLSSNLLWDTSRGKGFQGVAQVVFVCDHLPIHTQPSSGDKITKWIMREDPPTETFKESIDDVFRTLWQIASTNHLSRAFKKIEQRVAPVEFIFIGVLLYQISKQSLPIKANAVYLLRSTIRSKFRDIRNNTLLGAVCWNIIDAIIENPEDPDLDDVENNGPKKTKRSKKKRSLPGTEEDDDYRPEVPVRKLNKSQVGIRSKAR